MVIKNPSMFLELIQETKDVKDAFYDLGERYPVKEFHETPDGFIRQFIQKFPN